MLERPVSARLITQGLLRVSSAPVLEAKHLKKHFPITKGLALQRTVGWVRDVEEAVSFAIRPVETRTQPTVRWSARPLVMGKCFLRCFASRTGALLTRSKPWVMS